MQEIIGNMLAGLVGKKLDGYKTVIGGVAGVLYGIVLIVGHVYPGAGLPGATDSWEAIIGIFSAGLSGLGVVHKAYKAGLETPVPVPPLPGLQHPMGGGK